MRMENRPPVFLCEAHALRLPHPAHAPVASDFETPRKVDAGLEAASAQKKRKDQPFSAWQIGALGAKESLFAGPFSFALQGQSCCEPLGMPPEVSLFWAALRSPAKSA